VATQETLNAERAAFWAELSAAAPELGIEPSPGQEKEIPIGQGGRLKLKLSLSQDRTSVYLVARTPEARIWVESHLRQLALALRTVVGDVTGDAAAGRWFRRDNAKASVTIRRQWPEAIRWLRAQHATYTRAVSSIEHGATG